MKALLKPAHLNQQTEQKLPNNQALDISDIYQTIQAFYPNHIALILQTYRSIQHHPLQPQKHQERLNTTLSIPQSKRIQQSKRKYILAADDAYDYLYKQEFPKYSGRSWTLQPTINDIYYNPPPSKIPQQGTKAFWRWQERRLMVYAFTKLGYGKRTYLSCLTDKRYSIGRYRLKQVLFEVVREALNNIQECVKNSLQHPRLLISPPIVRVLAARLFNPRKHLRSQNSITFLNVLKMHYYLAASPVTKDDIQSLHQEIRQIVCSSKQYSLKYRLNKLCQSEIFVKGDEETYIKELDQVFVRAYLETRDLRITRQRGAIFMGGRVDPKKLTMGFVAIRLKNILKATLQKINYMMEILGIERKERIRSHRELVVLAKDSHCTEIHTRLLNFYLHPPLMDSTAIFAFYKKLKVVRQLMHLGKLQCDPQLDSLASKQSKVVERQQQIQLGGFANSPSINVLRQLFTRFQSLQNVKLEEGPAQQQ